MRHCDLPKHDHHGAIRPGSKKRKLYPARNCVILSLEAYLNRSPVLPGAPKHDGLNFGWGVDRFLWRFLARRCYILITNMVAFRLVAVFVVGKKTGGIGMRESRTRKGSWRLGSGTLE